MFGPVPGAGVAPRPPGAVLGWLAGAGVAVASGAVSPTARPCPVLLRSSVLGMIRNAPSAARTRTTPAKTSLRWAGVRSIATSGAAAGAARTGPGRPARYHGCRCRPVTLPRGRAAVARRVGPPAAWAPAGAPPGGMLTRGAGAPLLAGARVLLVPGPGRSL